MKLQKIKFYSLFILLLVIGWSNKTLCQFKALTSDISASRVLDDYDDDELMDEFISDGELYQIALGYTASLNNNFTIGSKVGYAQKITKFGFFSPSFGGILRKTKKNVYLKLGITSAYWAIKPGKGLFIESDLQGLVLLSAKSTVDRLQLTGALTTSTIDYREEVKNFVPSFRLGVGYSFRFKAFNFFIVISKEFRLSTYYTTTDNYRFMNQAFGVGFRYVFQDKFPENE